MSLSVALISILVRDYDEAIGFYVGVLGLRLVEDRPLSRDKRWVVVAPEGRGSGLLLAKAVGARQLERVGDQSGGRVFLFLHTDDFGRDHRRLAEAGVAFVEAPRREPYGTVAVFVDLYGARWDLIEPSRPAQLSPA